MVRKVIDRILCSRARGVAPKLGRWLLDLDAHIKTQKPFKRTRVAILDNGILSVSPVSYDATGASANEHLKEEVTEDSKSIWSRIQEGRSFVDDNSRLSPWLFASDPHGTQMANLICAIDPFCEIYIARVAEDSFGITAERVAKVCSLMISDYHTCGRRRVLNGGASWTLHQASHR
jgi:hypothetical protein